MTPDVVLRRNHPRDPTFLLPYSCKGWEGFNKDEEDSERCRYSCQILTNMRKHFLAVFEYKVFVLPLSSFTH